MSVTRFLLGKPSSGSPSDCPQAPVERTKGLHALPLPPGILFLLGRKRNARAARDPGKLTAVKPFGYTPLEACYFSEESAKRGPPSRRPESREETPTEAYAASLLHRTTMLPCQICSMEKADYDLPLPSGRHVLRRVCLLRRSLFHRSR